LRSQLYTDGEEVLFKTTRSITCHAIQDSHRFLQHQTPILPLHLDTVNGIGVHRPKDLSQLRNRLLFQLETSFPSIFYTCKKSMIKTMIRLNAMRRGAVRSVTGA
jgi:hypothetical protein